ncbi:MAG: PIG-L family deacetylase, partial [Synergistaceae bacterium]|nr:PIG-L family deacetylase [Synergistaceae bacterium]
MSAIIDQTRPDRYDSSFFHESYSGRRVLILVPHQDDEINVAANSIQNFTKAGADVYVMFANSGDYYGHYNFDVRMSEAANALKVLGLDKSHIFILGYGETLNNAESGH